MRTRIQIATAPIVEDVIWRDGPIRIEVEEVYTGVIYVAITHPSGKIQHTVWLRGEWENLAMSSFLTFDDLIRTYPNNERPT